MFAQINLAAIEITTSEQSLSTYPNSNKYLTIHKRSEIKTVKVSLGWQLVSYLSSDFARHSNGWLLCLYIIVVILPICWKYFRWRPYRLLSTRIYYYLWCFFTLFIQQITSYWLLNLNNMTKSYLFQTEIVPINLHKADSSQQNPFFSAIMATWMSLITERVVVVVLFCFLFLHKADSSQQNPFFCDHGHMKEPHHWKSFFFLLFCFVCLFVCLFFYLFISTQSR